jgi:hypothetical protein
MGMFLFALIVVKEMDFNWGEWKKNEISKTIFFSKILFLFLFYVFISSTATHYFI